MDIAILASANNVARLRAALRELRAEREYVPPFELRYLRRGHTIHFRCHREDVAGIRLDVMTRMRGTASFAVLWRRRTTLEVEPGNVIELLALPDLVASKKTRRDKDWPMVQRLVEANYAQFADDATPARIRFWLRELRTPEFLIECVTRFPEAARIEQGRRPAVAAASARDAAAVQSALAGEEAAIRADDELFWKPLLDELQQLRHDEARKRRGGRA
jgi:hypothetical protein